MYYWKCMLLIICFFQFIATNVSSESAGPTGTNQTNEEASGLNFQAIKKIHAHLDDDHDGSVNLNESVGFMVDELHVHDQARHSLFHGNDTQISVEDLWTSWQQSDVYNWTSADVVAWLHDTVGLSEYEENFEKLNITGRSLPRLAVEDVPFFQELGINNLKHRKKVSLRAADVVLFGPPIKGFFSWVKDIILLVVILFATLACWYSLTQKKNAQMQLENMVKDIEGLQQAEEDLQNLQEKLALAELGQMESQKVKQEMEKELLKEISSAKKEAERLHQERNKHKEEQIKMTLVEQELAEVRRALMKAEAEVETLSLRSPQALQQWLQATYKKESKQAFVKKQSALKQMEDAKEACDKIRKKRGTIFGTFRLVHGQGIDEVDQKILNARSALAEVTSELQERQHRWRQIELLCGFQIATDGMWNLTLDNMATKGRRSSVAQALAICANLGSMGSIPNPSASGSEDDLSSINGRSSVRRKLTGVTEVNGNGHVGYSNQTSPRSQSNRTYEWNKGPRRIGNQPDVETGSESESVFSCHATNNSFDEADCRSLPPIGPVIGAGYACNLNKKFSDSVQESERLPNDKTYKRTNTEPIMQTVSSVKDFRKICKENVDESQRPKSMPISQSTPTFSGMEETTDQFDIVADMVDNESLGSSSSISKPLQEKATFSIDSTSYEELSGSSKVLNSDDIGGRDPSVYKRGRSLKSRLMPRKKEEDGDTDTVKKKSLLKRLKGK